MTYDLISRMDAVQATRVGPSDEWSRDTKSGYELAATDCMMNILKVPPADLSLPLGAVAMRDAMVKALDERGQREQVDFGLGRETQNFYRAREIVKALPLPTHAALLAHAMRLPEVAAVRDAGNAVVARWDSPDWKSGHTLDHITRLRATLAALVAKP